MRTPRQLTALLAATLLAATAGVAATVPSAAAATATRIVGPDGEAWLTSSGVQTQPGPVVYGTTFSISATVVTDAGEQVEDGTLTVKRRLAGQTTWTTVASAATASLQDAVRARRSATYRILYSGSGDYSPAKAAATARVQRRLEVTPTSGRRAGLKGKVVPRYHGAMTVWRKHGTDWRVFTRIRTDSQSRFAVELPSPRRGKYFWRLTIRAGAGFTLTRSATYYTRRL